jgi:hypothetical protein
MCNLYSVTKGQKAIIELVKAIRDLAGNMPPNVRYWRKADISEMLYDEDEAAVSRQPSMN